MQRSKPALKKMKNESAAVEALKARLYSPNKCKQKVLYNLSAGLGALEQFLENLIWLSKPT